MLGIRTTYKGVKFRSRFEAQLAEYFDDQGIQWIYEPCSIPWQPPIKTYTPDFIVTLPNGTTFYVEAKGHFEPMSRSKMSCIKKQYPDMDIRFVFMDEKLKISKAPSGSTYKEWAEKQGYSCWSVDLNYINGGDSSVSRRKSRKRSSGKSVRRSKGRTAKSKGSASHRASVS